MACRFEYIFHKCRECDIDFFVAKTAERRRKKMFCPRCGENCYTDEVTNLWTARPFQYKRSWTQEENDIIMSGRQAGYSFMDIHEALPGRTIGAVRQQAQELKRRERNGIDGKGKTRSHLSKN